MDTCCSTARRTLQIGSGQQLTVFVVGHFFDHRLPDALCETAVNLPFDDERVDEVSRIVDGEQLEKRRLAGLPVDLEHRDMTAEWIRVVRRLEERFRSDPVSN